MTVFHKAVWPKGQTRADQARPACGSEEKTPKFAWQPRYMNCDACKEKTA